VQILPGVYLVAGDDYYPMERPGLDSNVYLVDAGTCLALVDCAFDEVSLDAIFHRIRRWGMDPNRISHLLLTHAHFDHSGNAKRLREQGVRIVAHVNEAEGMEAGDLRTIPYAFDRDFPATPVDVRLGADGGSGPWRLDIGDRHLEVVHAPGHTDGCLIYAMTVDGRRVWFTGDLFFRGGPLTAENILAWTGSIDYDRTRLLQTLTALHKETVDVILPGHRLVCLERAKTMLNTALVIAIQAWGNR
jgi:glyoxylase-like metal-dependent hydrolase (beta-lactamase superfamily II)